jgi:amino acid transporter
MNLHKLTKLTAIVIAILSIVFLALMNSDNSGLENKWVSAMIYLSYVVLAICIAAVLIFVLLNLFSSKENLKKTLISVGLFVGVIVISYVLADGSDVNMNGEVVSGATSKWVGTGIISFYVLTAVAFAAIAWTFLTKLKK